MTKIAINKSAGDNVTRYFLMLNKNGQECMALVANGKSSWWDVVPVEHWAYDS